MDLIHTLKELKNSRKTGMPYDSKSSARKHRSKLSGKRGIKRAVVFLTDRVVFGYGIHAKNLQAPDDNQDPRSSADGFSDMVHDDESGAGGIAQTLQRERALRRKPPI